MKTFDFTSNITKIALEAEKKIIGRESCFKTSCMIILSRYLAENREKSSPSVPLDSPLLATLC